MTQTFDDNSLGSVLTRVRSNWGWFVALGGALLFFGLVALGNLLFATFASIFVVGMMMIAGGIAHILLSFRARTWRHFLIWLLGGILDGVAGVLVLVDPVLASTVFTLFFAFMLVASGAARIWLGWVARSEDGGGWLVVAGIVTLLIGGIIVAGWPVDSLWVIGMLLAVDLLFQGWGYIAFGFGLRARM